MKPVIVVHLTSPITFLTYMKSQYIFTEFFFSEQKLSIRFNKKIYGSVNEPLSKIGV